MSTPASRISLASIATWARLGLVLPRPSVGHGSGVMGDPCIVWDDDLGAWRMVVFCQPGGHGQAVCEGGNPQRWRFLGALPFTNPEDVIGGHTHKPYLVLDAMRPNRAALIGGRYCLLSVAVRGGHKLVQRAWAERLAGPWTWETAPFIDLGRGGDQDARHVDAVSAIHFADRDETFIAYMGYPELAQPHPLSPFGSAEMLAVSRGSGPAEKRGLLIAPSTEPGHWASGWIGGFQIVPGVEHRWIALVNASPTAPRRDDTARHREEPPPSLPGLAVSDAELPDRGWSFLPQPIEWVKDIPNAALNAGEGVNLWRHHFLALPDGRWAMYYNSGTYGTEQIYGKIAR